MRTLGTMLTAAALAAALGCSEQSGPSRPPVPPPPPSLTADVKVRDQAGAAGPFALSATSSLSVEVSIAGAEPGSHGARIDILTPRGTLYAQFQGTIEVGADGTGRIARVLEVRGTPIDQFGQVGAWRFVLALGEQAALATAEVGLVE